MKKYALLLLMILVLMSILAAMLFTQNDPVEQAKKRRDEKLQTAAAEFIHATVLYYATHTALPWFPEEKKGANCFGSATLNSVSMNGLEHCINALASEDFLRSDYLETVPLEMLRVTNPHPQTGEELDSVVCFQPQSVVWQHDVQTHYTITGTIAPAGQCRSQGGSDFCYWCTQ